jgi:hypothetical protein
MERVRLTERAMIITSALNYMRDRPFKYGEFDCHIFAADIVRMYTFVDYAESFRGKYHDEKSAYKIVTQNGGPAEFVSKVLGKESRASFMAHVGDVVAYRVEDRKIMIGVCVGARAVFLNQRGGFEFRELGECLCSWEIE